MRADRQTDKQLSGQWPTLSRSNCCGVRDHDDDDDVDDATISSILQFFFAFVCVCVFFIVSADFFLAPFSRLHPTRARSLLMGAAAFAC